MINWSKYFDKIICVCYNKNEKRKQLLEYELKRVGILDSGIFEYQMTFQNNFINEYYKMIDTHYFSLKNEYNAFLSNARISSIMGHLNIIKKYYYNGYNRILIIEDDIRFLKDLTQVQQILQNIPDQNQWDLILFDKFALNKIAYHNMISDKKYIINKYFCKFEVMLSAACYCINRKGMEIMINVHDVWAFNITDWIFCITQINNLWKKIFAIKSMCVQVMFADNQTVKSEDHEEFLEKIVQFQQWYKNQQIRFSDYMINIDGTPYYYGGYIEV